MVFFVTLFYRPDFCRMILLLVFFGQFCSPFCFGKMLSLLIMFFCWLNISDQFFLTFGSLIFVRFMSYAQIFGGLPLPLVSYIKADFWGATPPLSFIHYEKCMKGGPPAGGVKGVGVKN